MLSSIAVPPGIFRAAHQPIHTLHQHLGILRRACAIPFNTSDRVVEERVEFERKKFGFVPRDGKPSTSVPDWNTMQEPIDDLRSTAKQTLAELGSPRSVMGV